MTQSNVLNGLVNIVAVTMMNRRWRDVQSGVNEESDVWCRFVHPVPGFLSVGRLRITALEAAHNLPEKLIDLVRSRVEFAEQTLGGAPERPPLLRRAA